MKIGTFYKDSYGVINGKIHGLGIGITSVMLSPEKSRDGKPYFKVIADPVGEAFEVGAAFEKTKGNKTYYSMSLDTPAFRAPLNAALFADEVKEGYFNLIWQRPEAFPRAEVANEAGHKTQRRYIGANTAAP